VSQIGVGNGNLGIVCHDGRLYTIGNNFYGQLGVGCMNETHTPMQVTKPTQVKVFGVSGSHCSGVHVRKFASGGDHSAIITGDGVFTCGNNFNGILGRKTLGNECDTFQQALPQDTNYTLLLHGASHVACGDGHTVVLTESAVVFTWGVCAYKCLGMDDRLPVVSPRALPPHLFDGKNIVDVCAGDNHQAAVSDDGTVFTWGDNQYYQLGRDKNHNNCMPQCVSFASEGAGTSAPHIVVVRCGRTSTFMLTQDGELYVTGNPPANSQCFKVPQRLGSEQVPPVLAVGITNQLVFAIDRLGALCTWGAGVPCLVDDKARARQLAIIPEKYLLLEWDLKGDPLRLDPPWWRGAKAIAFAMVGHSRLGSGSRAFALDVIVIDIILRFLNAWKDRVLR
jgi:alpha-tubulin suppressor-like RCC1 family protein